MGEVAWHNWERTQNHRTWEQGTYGGSKATQEGGIGTQCRIMDRSRQGHGDALYVPRFPAYVPKAAVYITCPPYVYLCPSLYMYILFICLPMIPLYIHNTHSFHIRASSYLCSLTLPMSLGFLYMHASDFSLCNHLKFNLKIS